MILCSFSWQVGWPLPARFGLPLLLVGYVAIVVILLTGLVRAYRDSDARGRRQLRDRLADHVRDHDLLRVGEGD